MNNAMTLFMISLLDGTRCLLVLICCIAVATSITAVSVAVVRESWELRMH